MPLFHKRHQHIDFVEFDIQYEFIVLSSDVLQDFDARDRIRLFFRGRQVQVLSVVADVAQLPEAEVLVGADIGLAGLHWAALAEQAVRYRNEKLDFGGDVHSVQGVHLVAVHRLLYLFCEVGLVEDAPGQVIQLVGELCRQHAILAEVVVSPIVL